MTTRRPTLSQEATYNRGYAAGVKAARAAVFDAGLTARIYRVADLAAICAAEHAAVPDAGLHALLFPPHPGDVFQSSAICSCGAFQWDADSPGDLFNDTLAIRREWTLHARAALPAPDPRPDTLDVERLR